MRREESREAPLHTGSDTQSAGVPEPCLPSWDEAARLQALAQYAILDTGREPGFDDIAELAADILDAPIAAVNFIAADRQWFKAEKGIGADTLPLDASICRWAILQPGVFVVPDLAQDERFEQNPLVHVAGGLRFYAGALLESPAGLPLGTVCVLDRQPRPEGITPRQQRALNALAGQAMAQLELRRAHTMARLENERLAAIFEQATVGISELGLDGQFLVVNDRLCEMLGRPREQLLQRAIVDVTHPADAAENLHLFSRLAAGGERFSIDKRYVRPDGDIFWASSSVTPLLDEHGRPRAALAVTVDITARKAAEWAADAARQKADALYRAYFENTPDPLFVLEISEDGGFLVEEVNPAHEAGVGLKIDDIRGKRIEDVLPPDAARRVLESYRHVLETGTIYQYREIFDLADGPQHWDTTLVPVRDGAGRIARIIGSSRNVTPQILAEEALRQSQKMEAIGQLTGGIAHDFNNLLTPIVGSLDMLQRKGLGGEREQRLIAGAAQSAERARTLVQRLLAFARRQPLQAVPVDIAELVTGMGDLVSSTTGPQIKVVIEAGWNLSPALADPNQLEMALLNLAVNARDAMLNGGTLRISVSEEQVGARHRSGLLPGKFIRLSVADTGTGMDESTLQRAIEPFFSTKGVGKGTGLGLSMVHGLAAQLGGALTIQSLPGLGTNIELWLPISTTIPDSVDRQTRDMPGAATPNRVALLVDDEELVRLSTADMLSDLGYSVLEASSAEEAMRLIAAGEPFDLLVTDYLMPGMTGADLAHAVQAARPGLPVLLVTGYAEVEDIEPGLARLTKPFREDELASSLDGLSLR